MKLSSALAKKIIRLSLLGTSTLGLLVSSGVSFAKYYTENNFNDNAGAAKFDGGTITFMNREYHQSEIYEDDIGIYAHYAEFKIEFDSEVKSSFDLDIRFAESGNTNWDSPGTTDYFFYFSGIFEGETQNQPYTVVLDENDGSCTLVKDNVGEMFFGSGGSFNTNCAYVYQSVDGINYTMETCEKGKSSSSFTLSNDGSILTLAKDKEVDFNSTYYFKFIFFVNVSSSEISTDANDEYDGNIEQCSVLYKINVEQVI